MYLRATAGGGAGGMAAASSLPYGSLYGVPHSSQWMERFSITQDCDVAAGGQGGQGAGAKGTVGKWGQGGTQGQVST